MQCKGGGMKTRIIGIFFLAALMLFFPLQIRLFQNQTLAGVESYYHMRIAIEITQGIPAEDTLITESIDYLLNPYHLFLAAGYSLFGAHAFVIFPALIAMLTFFLFWRLLITLKIPKTTQEWILLVYVLSPPLIATGFLNSPHSFVIALLLAG